MKKTGLFFTFITVLVVAGLAFWGGRASMKRTSASASQAASAKAGTKRAQQLYTCPMHPTVVETHPGKCPICGMTLVPIKQSSKEEDQASRAKTQADSKGKGKILYWRAPMNPNYISDKPGKSPMGMDLVPVYASEVSSGELRIDPTVMQNIGVTTAKVIQGPLYRDIRTYSVATWDETTLAVINTKVSGWIEKLDVNETGQLVHKGQPLLSIYSQQLVAAQQEYLSALSSIHSLKQSNYAALSHSGRQMLAAARQRLKLWDISDGQIAELDKNHRVRTTLTLYAPISGIVIQRGAVLGDHVTVGKNLMQIAKLSSIWVLGSVYQSDIPFLKAGMKATVYFDDLPGDSFQGTVDYVYPYIEGKSRTSQVRIRLPNPDGRILPQMYATVKLRVFIANNAVQVPDNAVIRSSSTDNVVFIERTKGQFTGRKVILGPEGENHMLMVRAGLQPGEKVVTAAQFLLDSQAKLNTAIEEMLAHKNKEASK